MSSNPSIYIDRAGNTCCGEDFMGGTICSDRPGHEGGHNCTCQTCGGDWMNETCTCGIRRCAECDEAFHSIEYEYCGDCSCEGSSEGPEEVDCYLLADHHGPCVFEAPNLAPSQEEIDEAIRSIRGVS